MTSNGITTVTSSNPITTSTTSDTKSLIVKQQIRPPNKVLKLDVSKINNTAVFCAKSRDVDQFTTTTTDGAAVSVASNAAVTMVTTGQPQSAAVTNGIGSRDAFREKDSAQDSNTAKNRDSTAAIFDSMTDNKHIAPIPNDSNQGAMTNLEDLGMTEVKTEVTVKAKGASTKKYRVNSEMTNIRPENLDTTNVRSADYYFKLVNYQCDDDPTGSGATTLASTNKPGGGGDSRQRSNSRLLSVMHTKEKPQPKVYLFKFHASLSQSTIDGRKTTTSACAVISMYFAQKFAKDPTVFPTGGPPICTLPDKIFRQVEEAIREGNLAHEVNYKGETVNLGPEEVILLTSHLGIVHAHETDIDTREPATLVAAAMSLGASQAIMLIKNCRVVSLVPCNDNEGLLLFDSHPHFVITDSVRKVYGAYLFYAQKEESVVRDLIRYYDAFCDSTPFYGKLVIFNM